MKPKAIIKICVDGLMTVALFQRYVPSDLMVFSLAAGIAVNLLAWKMFDVVSGDLWKNFGRTLEYAAVNSIIFSTNHSYTYSCLWNLTGIMDRFLVGFHRTIYLMCWYVEFHVFFPFLPNHFPQLFLSNCSIVENSLKFSCFFHEWFIYQSASVESAFFHTTITIDFPHICRPEILICGIL